MFLSTSNIAIGAALAVSALAFVDPLANIPDPSTLLPQAPAFPEGKKACAAQNILDNCLSQQTTVFNMCAYGDWACKCSAQKAVAGCFNNCPMDEAKSAHEGQITVFCNAAMREEEEKSKSAASKTGIKTVAAASKSAEWIDGSEETNDTHANDRRHHIYGVKDGKKVKNSGASFKSDESPVSFDNGSSTNKGATLFIALAIGAVSWMFL
ncbi:hypothetical protein IW140_005564 [Coemansia sp. RSA 1813]|nr:hypothetical protein EV178_005675 [Coemansia sp. RSA 1646]KAJ1767087.1 hypothetical protein LPJ74_005551 [Coemansia sp. RSA 1843]KAJ2086536.1 hypothetical protein IW138_005620 [Coemansia sp. RSA 986]KAJ2211879.1 hypothetical protein EV179_005113 [Coemansia sp. RSA 487]KAJ2564882.1 hypothetical protein IW140_005564 [Coemansia sp. RSA 1813]